MTTTTESSPRPTTELTARGRILLAVAINGIAIAAQTARALDRLADRPRPHRRKDG